MVEPERLVLPRHLRAEIVAHARDGTPDEVCGILAGRDGRVERVLPVRNTADQVAAERDVFRDRSTALPVSGRKPVHYYMDPLDQLRAYNEIDRLGLDVLGYYHSHTHTEARPSPTDVRLATDLYPLYVLVSLEQPEQPDVRAWRIHKSEPTAETGEVVEVVIESPEDRDPSA